MNERVEPCINEWWTRGRFPRHLIPEMAELGIAGNPYHGYGCPGRSFLTDGMVAIELSRGDPSIATFYGVHGGLAMGTIYLCGSEEQKQRWLPPMAPMELIGAFGVPEPQSGSRGARGLPTTCRRDGRGRGRNGPKEWHGNPSLAEPISTLARD